MTPTIEPRARWPWQRSLQIRILLTYDVVFVVVLALLMLVIGRVVYQAQLAGAEQALEIEAFLAANALQDPLSGYAAEFEAYAHWTQEQLERGHPAETQEAARPSAVVAAPVQVAARLQQMASTYAANTNTQVAILDPQGNVVADSAHPFTAVPNQFHQIEIQAALRGEEQHDIRPTSDSGEAMVYVAAPIQQGNRILGLVQLGRPLQDMTARARSLLMSLALVGLVAFLVATALAVGLSRRLVKPVREMEQASLAIADGDLDQRVPVETADELGALARAFNDMVEALRRMMTQQRLFVANASHELRTPLTNIKLRSEALLGPAGSDPAVAHRYLVEIDREADRLGRLANTLLDLSGLDDAEARRVPEPMDINPVLRMVVETLQLRAAQADLTLTADLPERLLVRILPEDVETIAVNLLDNATKYTPRSGQVRLLARERDGGCLIRVEDTGPGIPPEDLSHVFERFYRVDKARSRTAGTIGSGAGLGLSIVKELVERNGGSIQVESVVGQGTAFEVRF